MNLQSARRVLALGALACAVAAVPVGQARAQEDIQRCEGTVTDDEGNPIGGVTITFLNPEKNVALQPVKTSKKGKYAHNTLPANTGTGLEIKALLEGHKMVQITALTTRGDGTKVTEETYLIGSDQKVHNVRVAPQSRSDVTSKGKCVVDFMMAPESRYLEAYRRLANQRLAEKGETPGQEGTGGASGQAGTPAAPAAPSAPPGRSSLEKGKELISARDYAGAVAPLKEAVQEDPDGAEARRLLGDALLQVGNLAEAEPELRKALDLDPTITGANFDMATLYVKKGRLMQAIPHLEKELELNPDAPSILQNLGKLYADTKQFEKAAEIYDKLIQLSPDNLESYALLADLYKQMGDTAKERATYERMGAQDPTGMAFYNLGNIMFNKNEMTQAMQAYKNAIEQAPDNALAHYQLGLTYVNLAKFKEAVAELETFMKLKPKDPKAAEAKSLVADLKKMGG